MAATRDRLAGIEAGRGVAALLVVAVHVGNHVEQAYGPYFLGMVTSFGHAGVDFFFVLSGFIIMHVHHGDIGRPARLWNYVKRRVTRIYPFYWIVLAATLLLLAVVKPLQLPGLSRLLVDLSLVPAPGTLTVSVAWTLQFEMTFYVCFALLVLNVRLGLALFAVWLACILAGLGGVSGTGGLTALLGSYFGGHFFLGMLAAWVVARGQIWRPGLLLAVGVGWFLATGAAEDLALFVPTNFGPHLSYALASTLAVIGLVGCERAGRLPVPRVMTLLGGATYAIYLTHELVVGAVWQVLVRTGLSGMMGPAAALAVLWVASAVGGILVCLLVERPAIAIARGLLDGFRRPATVPPRTVPAPDP